MIALLPSFLALGSAAVIAALLTFVHPLQLRQTAAQQSATPDSAARVLALTTLCQGIHFSEEALTGFHVAFPALFDLPAIPFQGFLAFNVGWLVIWSASISGLRSRQPLALFAAWFLAIAGVLNGLAHPLMALYSGGYFPGLITSPVIGATAFWLGIRLWKASSWRAARIKV